MRYAFGDCVLDEDLRQLYRSGQLVHLAPKAYRLLQVLMGARPRVVSSLDLFQAVWPDVVVSESSLSTLVAELRHALGDVARKGKYIRTSLGFGYAFVARVAVLPAQAQVDERPPRGACGLTWGDRCFVVPEGVSVVGRASDVEIPIDEPTVSRHHARLTRRRADLTLEDLSSRNGTFRNGERVSGSVPLVDGDVLGIGSVRLAVSLTTPDGVETVRMES